jgi:hypothetical protein
MSHGFLTSDDTFPHDVDFFSQHHCWYRNLILLLFGTAVTMRVVSVLGGTVLYRPPRRSIICVWAATGFVRVLLSVVGHISDSGLTRSCLHIHSMLALTIMWVASQSLSCNE